MIFVQTWDGYKWCTSTISGSISSEHWQNCVNQRGTCGYLVASPAQFENYLLFRACIVLCACITSHHVKVNVTITGRGGGGPWIPTPPRYRGGGMISSLFPTFNRIYQYLEHLSQSRPTKMLNVCISRCRIGQGYFSDMFHDQVLVKTEQTDLLHLADT